MRPIPTPNSSDRLTTAGRPEPASTGTALRPAPTSLASHRQGNRALPVASRVRWFGRTCRQGFALLLGLLLCMGGLARASGTSSALVTFADPVTAVTLPYGSTVSMMGVFATGNNATIKDQSLTTIFGSVVSGTTYTTGGLTASKTFTLTVTNPAEDSVTSSVVVTITPITVAAITPAASSVTVSTTKQFYTTVVGGLSNAYTWAVDGVVGGNSTVGTITVGGLYTAPAATGAHTIKATSTEDATQFASTGVTVVAAPVATSLVASNANPLYGATFTLTPTFDASTGTGSIDYSVTCPASGAASAAVSTTWVGARTFTLSVTNAAGDAAHTSVTVTGQTVVVADVSPATKYVTAGYNTTFSSSVTGAQVITLDWSVDGIPGGDATVGTITSGGVYTAPATAGSHTITATSHAKTDVYKTATATVVLLPTLGTAFTPSASSVLYGGTTTFSATFSNGTAVITGTDGTNVVVTSPVSWTSPVLHNSTTYTLIVQNLAGDGPSSAVLVTVTGVTVEPLNVPKEKVSLTKTLQFSGGVVSGTSDTSVVWTVNGVTGGNAELGTFNATTLVYSAPAAMPSMTAPATGSTVTIRCASVANPAVFKEVTLTLYALPTITSFELL